MATRTATVTSVSFLRGNDDGSSLSDSQYKRVLIGFENLTGSTVIGGTDTLQIASINTAIAASTFDGLTYTPVSVSVYQPAVVSSVVYGATLSLSSQTLSLTPKLASDWSTNATLPAAVGTVPYQVAVLCKVA